MHDPVHGRCGQLLVGEDGAPSGELDVGGQDQAPRFVALRYHLEQEPGPVDVQRYVSELVEDHDVGAPYVLEQSLQPPLGKRARQAPDQGGCREEQHLEARVHRRDADGDREMGLAAPGLAVEDEVLRALHEPEVRHLLPAVSFRHDDLGEVEVVDGLHGGERRAPHQAPPPVLLAHLHLEVQKIAYGPQLTRRRLAREMGDRAFGEAHLLRALLEALDQLCRARHQASPPCMYAAS